MIVSPEPKCSSVLINQLTGDLALLNNNINSNSNVDVLNMSKSSYLRKTCLIITDLEIIKKNSIILA